ncbi:YnbE family lipoprotein [Marinobacter sp. HL-58]|uniref:YnbE family lipoprotein n=1 Tax=Marinobacter sp. HL-58 TaxID=1479237 RepID=UPI00048177B3|nr:YnbE family lipoprotein [Marinobacter sp. HL-58]KPP98000.1 MAG: YnbE-like lipoprotein [Marinobacter sp. HL-58]
MDRFRPGGPPGKYRNALIITALALGVTACTPTVQMEAPKEPITVNLNVKIQHEIYVKVDKDVDELFGEKGLF